MILSCCLLNPPHSTQTHPPCVLQPLQASTTLTGLMGGGGAPPAPVGCAQCLGLMLGYFALRAEAGGTAKIRDCALQVNDLAGDGIG